MRVLVVNAGSSSVKLRVVRFGAVSGADAGPDATTVEREDLPALGRAGAVDAVGHRVVHGGTAFRAAVHVDDAVSEQLAALSDLAPLHQPASLAALRVARRALPDVPHVACFDTAFHAGMPEAAATYAVPGEWRQRWPIRRYGFHGLSHASAARRASHLLGRPPVDLRLVTAHLGAGASLAAVVGGQSVDTTMGFTPLEGLAMATRAGSVDPGLVLWLQRHGGLTADAVASGLEHASGMLGLAGSADMREVLAAAAEGSRAAMLARDVYVHRLRAGIAAMTAAMDGLDGLVFTGGVGENSAVIRSLAVEGLSFLGLAIDATRNEEGTGDREIGNPGARARVLVVASREELEIGRQVRSLLTGS